MIVFEVMSLLILVVCFKVGGVEDFIIINEVIFIEKYDV